MMKNRKADDRGLPCEGESKKGALRRRLASSSGFTMVELLLAMFLVAMLTGVVGGGVSVVQDAWHKVVLKADAQVALSMAIHAVTAELRAADPSTVTIDSDNTQISFDSVDRGCKMTLCGPGSEDLIYYKALGKDDKIGLMTQKSCPNGLVPKTSFTYDKDNKLFTCKITIEREGRIYASQEIKVRPVNAL
ncbi:MAG: prepilin-type N-terminal cleavage/methylation domain-containing protein [Eubacteriales bacterium]|nr:prepilin-type N-terminal cleavage/methylation domain-containing protein [Eubacteriales bacterium]